MSSIEYVEDTNKSGPLCPSTPVIIQNGATAEREVIRPHPWWFHDDLDQLMIISFVYRRHQRLSILLNVDVLVVKIHLLIILNGMENIVVHNVCQFIASKVRKISTTENNFLFLNIEKHLNNG